MVEPPVALVRVIVTALVEVPDAGVITGVEQRIVKYDVDVALST